MVAAGRHFVNSLTSALMKSIISLASLYSGNSILERKSLTGGVTIIYAILCFYVVLRGRIFYTAQMCLCVDVGPASILSYCV
jgi:hypothetical protein